MADPNYGKITDERVAELRSRIGLDLDPDSYLPVSKEVPQSRGGGSRLKAPTIVKSPVIVTV